MSIATNAPTSEVVSDRWLKNVFWADRATAITTGTAMVVGGAWLAPLMGWSTWVVVGIGLGLLPYALLLHRIYQTESFTSTLAKVTMELDFAWVIASVAFLVFWPDMSTTLGTWIVGLVAVFIADMGILKFIGFRKATAQ